MTRDFVRSIGADPRAARRALRAACDVLVIGGGAAALCAAISARENGADVTMVDAAPYWMRGGNARHARNLRLAHDSPSALSPDSYSESEFVADLRRVAGDGMDETLAAQVAHGSLGIAGWLAANGVRFQPVGSGLPYSRRTAFFMGGGMAAINGLYARAREIGVEILHEAEACGLRRNGDRIVTVDIARAGTIETIAPRATVFCAGGHQADRALLREGFGTAADGMFVRGSPYVTGRVLRLLIQAGARTTGDLSKAHIVAVDARGPAFDGGIVTRVECIPLGIVVDRAAQRFADEGADTWRTHFSRWGERLLQAPGSIAYVVLDAEGLKRAPASALKPVQAASIGELATRLGLDPVALTKTVDAYNAAIRVGEPRTDGLTPPKSAWAAPILVAPFAGYPMRPGVTFTHFGLAVDPALRVVLRDGSTIENGFAAGMIMSANILPRGYVSGLAVTLCAVFGRQAGAAACHVRD